MFEQISSNPKAACAFGLIVGVAIGIQAARLVYAQDPLRSIPAPAARKPCGCQDKAADQPAAVADPVEASGGG